MDVNTSTYPTQFLNKDFFRDWDIYWRSFLKEIYEMRILPGMLQFLSLLSSFSMGAFWPVVKRIMELCLKNSCWSISFAKETFLQLDMELGHWVIGLVLPTCNYVFSLSTAHFKMAFCCTDAAVYVYSYGWKFRIRGVKDISEHWGRSFVNGLCQQFYCYKKKKERKYILTVEKNTTFK